MKSRNQEKNEVEGVHARFRQMREKYGLTQVGLARRLGVTNSHISAIESGKTIPSMILTKLASKELGVNEPWLRNGIPPMYPEKVEACASRRVIFTIDKCADCPQYTVAVTVYREDRYAPMPAQMFPKFESIVYAYIFCVGIIHTAYPDDADVMFTSHEQDTIKKINELQGE